MARLPFRPSAEQRRSVKVMAGLGMRHQDIALVVDIAEKTLRKHFRQELALGAIEANAKVLQTVWNGNLWRQASSGCRVRMISPSIHNGFWHRRSSRPQCHPSNRYGINGSRNSTSFYVNQRVVQGSRGVM